MAAPLSYFSETHEQMRLTVRKFVEREILPHVAQWEEEGKKGPIAAKALETLKKFLTDLGYMS